jgi:hypothetical protein
MYVPRLLTHDLKQVHPRPKSQDQETREARYCSSRSRIRESAIEEHSIFNRSCTSNPTVIELEHEEGDALRSSKRRALQVASAQRQCLCWQCEQKFRRHSRKKLFCEQKFRRHILGRSLVFEQTINPSTPTAPGQSSEILSIVHYGRRR